MSYLIETEGIKIDVDGDRPEFDIDPKTITPEETKWIKITWYADNFENDKHFYHEAGFEYDADLDEWVEVMSYKCRVKADDDA